MSFDKLPLSEQYRRLSQLRLVALALLADDDAVVQAILNDERIVAVAPVDGDPAEYSAAVDRFLSDGAQ